MKGSQNKILIHHHATVYRDPEIGALFLPSFIGCWVNEISKLVSHVGLLFHESKQKTSRHDTLITGDNVIHENLGAPGNYKDLLKKNRRIKEVCRQVKPNYDILIIRGFTPGQYRVFRELSTLKVFFLLVGALKSSKPPLRFNMIGLIQYIYFFKRRSELGRIAKKAVLLANSPAVVDEIKEVYDKEARYVSTNTLTIADIRPEKNWNPESPLRLFFCGRIVEDKGIFELLEAFYFLLKSGVDARLNLAGSAASEMKQRMRELAYWKEIEQKINFLGFVQFGPELLNTYSEQDIFVLPSYHEGFPHSIWEASATSVPVIVTPVGGIPGIINENEVAFIRTKSSDDIIKAIHFMLEHLEETNKTMNRLYQKTKLHTVEKGVETLLNIILS